MIQPTRRNVFFMFKKKAKAKETTPSSTTQEVITSTERNAPILVKKSMFFKARSKTTRKSPNVTLHFKDIENITEPISLRNATITTTVHITTTRTTTSIYDPMLNDTMLTTKANQTQNTSPDDTMDDDEITVTTNCSSGSVTNFEDVVEMITTTPLCGPDQTYQPQVRSSSTTNIAHGDMDDTYDDDTLCKEAEDKAEKEELRVCIGDNEDDDAEYIVDDASLLLAKQTGVSAADATDEGKPPPEPTQQPKQFVNTDYTVAALENSSLSLNSEPVGTCAPMPKTKATTHFHGVLGKNDMNHVSNCTALPQEESRLDYEMTSSTEYPPSLNYFPEAPKMSYTTSDLNGEPTSMVEDMDGSPNDLQPFQAKSLDVASDMAISETQATQQPAYQQTIFQQFNPSEETSGTPSSICQSIVAEETTQPIMETSTPQQTYQNIPLTTGELMPLPAFAKRIRQSTATSTVATIDEFGGDDTITMFPVSPIFLDGESTTTEQQHFLESSSEGATTVRLAEYPESGAPETNNPMNSGEMIEETTGMTTEEADEVTSTSSTNKAREAEEEALATDENIIPKIDNLLEIFSTPESTTAPTPVGQHEIDYGVPGFEGQDAPNFEYQTFPVNAPESKLVYLLPIHSSLLVPMDEPVSSNYSENFLQSQIASNGNLTRSTTEQNCTSASFLSDGSMMPRLGRNNNARTQRQLDVNGLRDSDLAIGIFTPPMDIPFNQQFVVSDGIASPQNYLLASPVVTKPPFQFTNQYGIPDSIEQSVLDELSKEMVSMLYEKAQMEFSPTVPHDIQRLTPPTSENVLLSSRDIPTFHDLPTLHDSDCLTIASTNLEKIISDSILQAEKHADLTAVHPQTTSALNLDYALAEAKAQLFELVNGSSNYKAGGCVIPFCNTCGTTSHQKHTEPELLHDVHGGSEANEYEEFHFATKSSRPSTLSMVVSTPLKANERAGEEEFDHFPDVVRTTPRSTMITPMSTMTMLPITPSTVGTEVKIEEQTPSTVGTDVKIEEQTPSIVGAEITVEIEEPTSPIPIFMQICANNRYTDPPKECHQTDPPCIKHTESTVKTNANSIYEGIPEQEFHHFLTHEPPREFIHVNEAADEQELHHFISTVQDEETNQTTTRATERKPQKLTEDHIEEKEKGEGEEAATTASEAEVLITENLGPKTAGARGTIATGTTVRETGQSPTSYFGTPTPRSKLIHVSEDADEQDQFTTFPSSDKGFMIASEPVEILISENVQPPPTMQATTEKRTTLEEARGTTVGETGQSSISYFTTPTSRRKFIHVSEEADEPEMHQFTTFTSSEDKGLTIASEPEEILIAENVRPPPTMQVTTEKRTTLEEGRGTTVRETGQSSTSCFTTPTPRNIFIYVTDEPGEQEMNQFTTFTSSQDKGFTISSEPPTMQVTTEKRTTLEEASEIFTKVETVDGEGSSTGCVSEATDQNGEDETSQSTKLAEVTTNLAPTSQAISSAVEVITLPPPLVITERSECNNPKTMTTIKVTHECVTLVAAPEVVDTTWEDDIEEGDAVLMSQCHGKIASHNPCVTLAISDEDEDGKLFDETRLNGSTPEPPCTEEAICGPCNDLETTTFKCPIICQMKTRQRTRTTTTTTTECTTTTTTECTTPTTTTECTTPTTTTECTTPTTTTECTTPTTTTECTTPTTTTECTTPTTTTECTTPTTTTECTTPTTTTECTTPTTTTECTTPTTELTTSTTTTECTTPFKPHEKIIERTDANSVLNVGGVEAANEHLHFYRAPTTTESTNKRDKITEYTASMLSEVVEVSANTESHFHERKGNFSARDDEEEVGGELRKTFDLLHGLNENADDESIALENKKDKIEDEDDLLSGRYESSSLVFNERSTRTSATPAAAADANEEECTNEEESTNDEVPEDEGEAAEYSPPSSKVIESSSVTEPLKNHLQEVITDAAQETKPQESPATSENKVEETKETQEAINENDEEASEATQEALMFFEGQESDSSTSLKMTPSEASDLTSSEVFTDYEEDPEADDETSAVPLVQISESSTEPQSSYSSHVDLRASTTAEATKRTTNVSSSSESVLIPEGEETTDDTIDEDEKSPESEVSEASTVMVTIEPPIEMIETTLPDYYIDTETTTQKTEGTTVTIEAPSEETQSTVKTTRSTSTTLKMTEPPVNQTATVDLCDDNSYITNITEPDDTLDEETTLTPESVPETSEDNSQTCEVTSTQVPGETTQIAKNFSETTEDISQTLKEISTLVAKKTTQTAENVSKISENTSQTCEVISTQVARETMQTAKNGNKTAEENSSTSAADISTTYEGITTAPEDISTQPALDKQRTQPAEDISTAAQYISTAAEDISTAAEYMCTQLGLERETTQTFENVSKKAEHASETAEQITTQLALAAKAFKKLHKYRNSNEDGKRVSGLGIFATEGLNITEPHHFTAFHDGEDIICAPCVEGEGLMFKATTPLTLGARKVYQAKEFYNKCKGKLTGTQKNNVTNDSKTTIQATTSKETAKISKVSQQVCTILTTLTTTPLTLGARKVKKPKSKTQKNNSEKKNKSKSDPVSKSKGKDSKKKNKGKPDPVDKGKGKDSKKKNKDKPVPVNKGKDKGVKAPGEEVDKAEMVHFTSKDENTICAPCDEDKGSESKEEATTLPPDSGQKEEKAKESSTEAETSTVSSTIEEPITSIMTSELTEAPGFGQKEEKAKESSTETQTSTVSSTIEETTTTIMTSELAQAPGFSQKEEKAKESSTEAQISTASSPIETTTRIISSELAEAPGFGQKEEKAKESSTEAQISTASSTIETTTRIISSELAEAPGFGQKEEKAKESSTEAQTSTVSSTMETETTIITSELVEETEKATVSSTEIQSSTSEISSISVEETSNVVQDFVEENRTDVLAETQTTAIVITSTILETATTITPDLVEFPVQEEATEISTEEQSPLSEISSIIEETTIPAVVETAEQNATDSSTEEQVSTPEVGGTTPTTELVETAELGTTDISTEEQTSTSEVGGTTPTTELVETAELGTTDISTEEQTSTFEVGGATPTTELVETAELGTTDISTEEQTSTSEVGSVIDEITTTELVEDVEQNTTDISTEEQTSSSEVSSINVETTTPTTELVATVEPDTTDTSTEEQPSSFEVSGINVETTTPTTELVETAEPDTTDTSTEEQTSASELSGMSVETTPTTELVETTGVDSTDSSTEEQTSSSELSSINVETPTTEIREAAEPDTTDSFREEQASTSEVSITVESTTPPTELVETVEPDITYSSTEKQTSSSEVSGIIVETTTATTEIVETAEADTTDSSAEEQASTYEVSSITVETTTPTTELVETAESYTTCSSTEGASVTTILPEVVESAVEGIKTDAIAESQASTMEISISEQITTTMMSLEVAEETTSLYSQTTIGTSVVGESITAEILPTTLVEVQATETINIIEPTTTITSMLAGITAEGNRTKPLCVVRTTSTTENSCTADPPYHVRDVGTSMPSPAAKRFFLIPNKFFCKPKEKKKQPKKAPTENGCHGKGIDEPSEGQNDADLHHLAAMRGRQFKKQKNKKLLPGEETVTPTDLETDLTEVGKSKVTVFAPDDDESAETRTCSAALAEAPLSAEVKTTTALALGARQFKKKNRKHPGKLVPVDEEVTGDVSVTPSDYVEDDDFFETAAPEAATPEEATTTVKATTGKKKKKKFRGKVVKILDSTGIQMVTHTKDLDAEDLQHVITTSEYVETEVRTTLNAEESTNEVTTKDFVTPTDGPTEADFDDTEDSLLGTTLSAEETTTVREEVTTTDLVTEGPEADLGDTEDSLLGTTLSAEETTSVRDEVTTTDLVTDGPKEADVDDTEDSLLGTTLSAEETTSVREEVTTTDLMTDGPKEADVDDTEDSLLGTTLSAEETTSVRAEVTTTDLVTDGPKEADLGDTEDSLLGTTLSAEETTSDREEVTTTDLVTDGPKEADVDDTEDSLLGTTLNAEETTSVREEVTTTDLVTDGPKEADVDDAEDSTTLSAEETNVQEEVTKTDFVTPTEGPKGADLSDTKDSLVSTSLSAEETSNVGEEVTSKDLVTPPDDATQSDLNDTEDSTLTERTTKPVEQTEPENDEEEELTTTTVPAIPTGTTETPKTTQTNKGKKGKMLAPIETGGHGRGLDVPTEGVNDAELHHMIEVDKEETSVCSPCDDDDDVAETTTALALGARQFKKQKTQKYHSKVVNKGTTKSAVVTYVEGINAADLHHLAQATNENETVCAPIDETDDGEFPETTIPGSVSMTKETTALALGARGRKKFKEKKFQGSKVPKEKAGQGLKTSTMKLHEVQDKEESSTCAISDETYVTTLRYMFSMTIMNGTKVVREPEEFSLGTPALDVSEAYIASNDPYHHQLQSILPYLSQQPVTTLNNLNINEEDLYQHLQCIPCGGDGSYHEPIHQEVIPVVEFPAVFSPTVPNVSTMTSVSGRYPANDQNDMASDVPDSGFHLGTTKDFVVTTDREEKIEEDEVSKGRHLTIAQSLIPAPQGTPTKHTTNDYGTGKILMKGDPKLVNVQIMSFAAMLKELGISTSPIDAPVTLPTISCLNITPQPKWSTPIVTSATTTHIVTSATATRILTPATATLVPKLYPVTTEPLVLADTEEEPATAQPIVNSTTATPIVTSATATPIVTSTTAIPIVSSATATLQPTLCPLTTETPFLNNTEEGTEEETATAQLIVNSTSATPIVTSATTTLIATSTIATLEPKLSRSTTEPLFLTDTEEETEASCIHHSQQEIQQYDLVTEPTTKADEATSTISTLEPKLSRPTTETLFLADTEEETEATCIHHSQQEIQQYDLVIEPTTKADEATSTIATLEPKLSRPTTETLFLADTEEETEASCIHHSQQEIQQYDLVTEPTTKADEATSTIATLEPKLSRPTTETLFFADTEEATEASCIHHSQQEIQQYDLVTEPTTKPDEDYFVDLLKITPSEEEIKKLSMSDTTTTNRLVHVYPPTTVATIQTTEEEFEGEDDEEDETTTYASTAATTALTTTTTTEQATTALTTATTTEQATTQPKTTKKHKTSTTPITESPETEAISTETEAVSPETEAVSPETEAISPETEAIVTESTTAITEAMSSESNEQLRNWYANETSMKSDRHTEEEATPGVSAVASCSSGAPPSPIVIIGATDDLQHWYANETTLSSTVEKEETAGVAAVVSSSSEEAPPGVYWATDELQNWYANETRPASAVRVSSGDLNIATSVGLERVAAVQDGVVIDDGDEVSTMEGRIDEVAEEELSDRRLSSVQQECPTTTEVMSTTQEQIEEFPTTLPTTKRNASSAEARFTLIPPRKPFQVMPESQKVRAGQQPAQKQKQNQSMASVIKTEIVTSLNNHSLEIPSLSKNASIIISNDSKVALPNIKPLPIQPIEIKQDCNAKDFGISKNCMCSIDSLIGDLRNKTSEKDFHQVLDSYLCPSVAKKTNITIGKDRRHYRRQLTSIDFIFRKPRKIKDPSLHSVFIEDIQLEDTDYHVYATPGSKIKIPCIGGSNNNNSEEMASAVWSFSDGTPLTEGKTQEKDGTLIIENIIPQDAGNYTCRNGGRKYPHQLSTVSLASYKIGANILYAFPGKCTNEYLELMYGSFPVKFEDMLCGESHSICYVNVTNKCLTKKTDFVMVAMQVVVEPLTVILPTLDQNDCKISCQQNIYAKIVSILLKNVEIFETLPIFYSLGEKKFDLVPTPAAKDGAKDKTQIPDMNVQCFPGFGLIENTHVCCACGKNMYSTGETPQCIKCPPKQYQPNEGSKSCLPCNTFLEDPACLPLPIEMNIMKFKILIGCLVTAVALLIGVCACLACKTKAGQDHLRELEEVRIKKRRQRQREFDRRDVNEVLPLNEKKPFMRPTKAASLSMVPPPELIQPPSPPPPDFL